MRAGFFILLLANILYFAWSVWLAPPRHPEEDNSIATLLKLVLTSEVPARPWPALQSGPAAQ